MLFLLKITTVVFLFVRSDVWNSVHVWNPCHKETFVFMSAASLVLASGKWFSLYKTCAFWLDCTVHVYN